MSELAAYDVIGPSCALLGVYNTQQATACRQKSIKVEQGYKFRNDFLFPRLVGVAWKVQIPKEGDRLFIGPDKDFMKFILKYLRVEV